MKALEEANEVLISALKSDLPPETKLGKAILGHVKVLTTEFSRAPVQQGELGLPKTMRDEVIRERDRFEKSFLTILKEGIEEGIFEDKDLKMRAYCILGALNWIPKWYSPEGKLTPEEIAEAITTYLIKGLLCSERKLPSSIGKSKGKIPYRRCLYITN